MRTRVVVLSLLTVLLCMGVYVSAQYELVRTKGDVNEDGAINVLDAIRTVNIILELQSPPTDDELWSADCNGDGRLNIIDVLGIVNVILEIGTCVSSCAEMDCDDANPCTEDYCDSLLVVCVHDTVWEGTTEVCGDGIDNDCDGTTDEEGGIGCTLYYRDFDRDGYGTPDDSRCLCAPDSCYDAAQAGDCNDSDFFIYPGAVELCNGKDDDCDEVTDEEGAAGCTIYFRDDDRDGYGQSADSRCLCSSASPYDVTQDGDCDDSDDTVHPKAAESCNGKDDDCDQTTDEEGATGCTAYYRDNDNDGYGQSGDSKCLCSGVHPYDVTRSGDCNDGDASLHPGAAEICSDGKDNDCDRDTDCDDAGCANYPACLCPSATDYDGNTYQTIRIGNQCWMAENLKVTHYRNGDGIPNVTENDVWDTLSTGAYCNYANDSNKVGTYGRLYNWHVVDDNRGIAPSGWHVPSDDEWKQLEMYLGMSQTDADSIGLRGTDQGGELKEAGTSHWTGPNTGATNASGFTALPAGYRDPHGSFGALGDDAFFWSSGDYDSGEAWYRGLNYSSAQVLRFCRVKDVGMSVRCIRD